MLRLLILPLVLATLASPARAHSLDEVQKQLLKHEQFVEVVDRPAPDFTLQDPDGRPVRLADFRGKVVVLYFIYASCPDVCPLQSDLIAKIQKQVNATPMRDLVQFIAVETDPEDDPPDMLKAYGPAHNFDPANWMFLTSPADQPALTREVALAYGLKFTRTEGDGLIHGAVTHVIDREGRLRARFHGLEFDPTNFIVEVNALSNDHHGAGERLAFRDNGGGKGAQPANGELPTELWAALGLAFLSLVTLSISLVFLVRHRNH